MIADLLSLGMPSRLLTMEDVIPEEAKKRYVTPYDITEEMNERFFCDIPKGKQIEWKHGCIVGKPGSGKTEMFKFRGKYAYEKYGPENLNIIYTDDLRVGVNEINDKPVQYLIIDDATKNMSSRKAYDNTEILGTFNRLRHHFDEYLKTSYGLIMVDFGWQRWIDLDPGFRDGSSLIFKTAMTTKRECDAIEEVIGPDYLSGLYTIWDSIDRGNNKAKSISVGRIGPRPIEMNGVGMYRSDLVDFPQFPEIIYAEDYFDEEGNIIWNGRRKTKRIDPLEGYRDDPQWADRIKAYDLRKKGITLKRTAEIIGGERGDPVSGMTISRWCENVVDLITKNGGNTA